MHPTLGHGEHRVVIDEANLRPVKVVVDLELPKRLAHLREDTQHRAVGLRVIALLPAIERDHDATI
ncbi:MAG: hypothetical protein ABTQ32_28435 [Myxococcaceae bacterium]